MITRTRFLLVLLLLVAVVLTFYKVPFASSQGVTVQAMQVEEMISVADIESALWDEATAVSIPLSAQVTTRPLFAQANIKSMTARSLYNDSQIAFLLEWEDGSLDEATIRPQDFSDAVAIQFPLGEGQPFFCMGQQGGDVNIWHWKADWQASMAAPQDVDTTYPNMYVDHYDFSDMEAGAAATIDDYIDVNYVPALAAGNLFAAATYASPVEDLMAGGFGSLTSQPAEMQNVQGYGEYADGKWRVLFLRELLSAELEDARFETGQVYSLAFAAWDGENEERNGQKATSQWVSLQLGGDIEGLPASGTDSSGGSKINQLEGLGFVLVPMFIVLVLSILLVVGVFILTKLPDRK